MKNRKILISFALLALVFVLSSFNTTKAEKSKFKNLQVLPNDITKAQLDDIMDAYCVSLNVKCSFCHVKGNMASDDNDEKAIARKMMTMTNEINEKYFGKDTGIVGCMTCHNGKKNPNDME